VQASARRSTIRHANLLKSNEHAWAGSLSDAAGHPDALAWFDVGYLSEAYKQWLGKGEPNPAARLDGYSLVRKAISMRGSDPEAALQITRPTLLICTNTFLFWATSTDRFQTFLMEERCGS
jgi:hypothetical protein